MTTPFEPLFARSIGRFVDRVAGVPDDAWSAPTPCADWDVRALVNHVMSEQVWAPHMVGGETVEEVGDRYDGDLLGDDPLATIRAAAAVATDAFAAADADAVVHASYADIPLQEYLSQMLTDTEVHGWDLAVATGQDATVDPEIAALLVEVWEPQQELLRGSGVFGEEVAVPGDASPAERLLGLLGRRAQA